MCPTRQIYLLDPKLLSPETIAVTFAKTSRSPQSFNEIAAELSDEKSADFNEKWVVGYGHSSVAEHAVLHLAVENISRLAVECLESNRLASYTEKSSRYQIWGLDHFYLPAEFEGSDLEKPYKKTCEHLFSAYQKAVSAVQDYLQRTTPQQSSESPAAFKARIRTQCADVCRYFLPACSLANVGMTINARALEHAICKMLSHPLEEVQRIGEEIKKVSQENVPTLVKYADQKECLVQIREKLSDYTKTVFKINERSTLEPVEGSISLNQNQATNDWMRIIHADEDGELRVLAGLLVRFGEMSYEEALAKLTSCSPQEKAELVERFLGGLGEHDNPLRELEYANLTVEIVLDQGAYFELKRHRMMTQTPQHFTARLGYAVPRLFSDAGIAGEFRSEMEAVIKVYEDLYASHPEAAAYILPNAFNRRVLLQMNLRSALHFTKLRCAPNAHFAIRRVAQRLAAEIQQRFPLFADHFRPNTQETWESITQDFFENYQ